MEKIKGFPFVFIVLLLSIPTVLPLLPPGIYTMHDNTQVARVFQMAVALQDGMFPVRWVKDLGYGYGYPLFNFYAPFPYYVGGILYLLTSSVITSTKIMIGLGTLLAGASMYFASSRLLGKWAGIASALTYMYFPYHALNIYVRGAIGEMYAYAFLPLFFYGFFILLENSKGKKILKDSISPIVITATSFAAVTISHNLTAFMLSIILIPLGFIGIFFTKNKFRFFLYLTTSFTLGALLSAFYAIPALLEMGYTNVMSQVGGGADFHDHYVCITQLWTSNWGYAGSTSGCTDGISFALGKNNIILVFTSIIFSLYYFFKMKKLKKLFLFLSIFVTLILSLFLTLNFSRFLWTHIPSIEFLQFPWRFLNFSALSISLILGFIVWTAIKLNFKKIGIGLSILISASQLLLHQDVFSAQRYDMTTEKEYMRREYLRFEASKISDEYLPKNFKKPKNENELFDKKVELVTGGGKIMSINESTNNVTTAINVDGTAEIKINSAPFPAWKLFVNGEEKDYLKKDDGIYFSLAPGNYEIEYKYVSTPTQRVANLLSIIGLGVLLIGIIWSRKK